MCRRIWPLSHRSRTGRPGRPGRRAGERFRATATFKHAASPTTDPARDVMPATLRRATARRWGLVASAAAVAAALVVGGTLAVQGLTDHNRTPSGTTAPLQGTVWQLLGYGSERNDDSSATFYIGSDGNLVADDACTVVTARTNAANGHLYPTNLQVRPRSCVDANAPTFTTGVDILTAAPMYSIHGHQLTLSDGHTAMHLESLPGAVPPTSDVPTLTDTQWRLARAISPSSKVTHARGESFAITDGRLEAGDGCDTITADATQSGNRVELKNVKSTQHKCPAGADDPVIDDVLGSGSISQVVRAGVLTVTTKGAGTLVYAWQPADEAATTPAALTGMTWHIASVALHASVGTATLRIGSGGRYVLNDGCSQFSGRADVEYGALKLTGVPARPSCGGSAGAQATTIDSYLSNRTLWSVRGGDLVIDGASAQADSLVFTKAVPAPSGSTALKGTTWQLTGVSATKAPLTLTPKDVAIRLGFVNKGKIDYDDGVNQYEGSLTVGADDLHITRLAGTAKGCIASAHCAQAGVVHNVLSGDPSWSINADQLTVTKPGAGKLVYRLTSSPDDSTTPSGSSSSAADADPSVLRGKSWRLYSLEHESGNSSSGQSASDDVTLAFSADGSVFIGHSCLSHGYKINFDGRSAVLSDPFVDGGTACPGGQAPRDTSDSRAVDAVMTPGQITWTVSGNALTISRAGETLTFHSS